MQAAAHPALPDTNRARSTSERIRLRGENKTVISIDTMTFRQAGTGTEMICTAEFAFKGAARYLAPILRPVLARLGNQAETGLRQALGRL